MEENTLLEIKNVSKNFGATKALQDVSIRVEKGSIHSLLGRNGAGKSTLVNIIAGLYPPTSGTVLFEGEDIEKYNVFERQNKGIRLVPQHESVVPDMSIGENIFLGLWPKKANGLIDWKTVYKQAHQELQQYGLDVDPHKSVRELSSVDTRKVNIIRAMHGGAKLIILDEPTTALTDKERLELFGFINSLKQGGTAFVFISHYLNEVMELSDDITVIRDGHAYPGKQPDVPLTQEYLANLVAGEAVELTTRPFMSNYEECNKVLECENFMGECIDRVSFSLYGGEILGVVGFPGSGARETCRAVFGMNKIKSGSMKINGKPVRVNSPKKGLANYVAYISHDRHREGLTPQFTVNYNIGMPIINGELKQKMGFINKRKEREISENYKNLLKIKCNGIDDFVDSLSGGNQQKVVVSKYLASNPKVLILDEPTIGIDIKSREEIIGTIHEMTKQNVGVMYLTNDFEELLRVADRLVFFRDGKIIAEEKNDNLTIEDIISIRDNVKAQEA